MYRFFVNAIIGFCVCAAFQAFGQTQEFSADIVSTTAGAGVMTGKIYVSKDKSRMEMSQGIVIARLDKKIAWMLMPKQKKYMEHPLDPRSAVGAGEKMPGEIERTLVGKEAIDGRSTDKYRIVYLSAGKNETVFQWIDPSTKIPVKTAAEDDSWSTEFKNIRSGAQAESLFDVPAGYDKFSMMSPADISNMIQNQLPNDSLPQGQ